MPGGGRLALFGPLRTSSPRREETATRRNALLRIPAADVERIFALSQGTKRVDMLFRVAQQHIISRAVVATVAQQEDYMKRVRDNGGSRTHLRPEGSSSWASTTATGALPAVVARPGDPEEEAPVLPSVKV